MTRLFRSPVVCLKRLVRKKQPESSVHIRASPVSSGGGLFLPGAAHLIDRRVRPWLWLALAVAACAVSWSYMHRVLMPWETYVNVTKGRLQQQMGDLYPRWVGTRELLLHGRDPYSADVSHEIQIAFYGHRVEQTYDKPPSEI